MKDEYKFVYNNDVEDGPFGATNENMLIPFDNEQEHMKQAIRNFKIHLKKQREQGIIEKSQEIKTIKAIEKRLSKNGKITVDEGEKIVLKYTGMGGDFTFIHSFTIGKEVSLESYNRYVENNLKEYGKKGFFYKYIEFYLLYLVMAMIIYLPIHYYNYSNRNYLELYKYRNQLTIKNLVRDIFVPVRKIFVAITLNNIFYYIYIKGEFRDFIYAFIQPYIMLIPITFIVSYSILLNIITKRWFISSLITVGILLYSNMPVKDGLLVKWMIKPFSVLVRHTGSFWKEFDLKFLYENLILLFIFSIIFSILSSKSMRKRNA